MLSHPPHQQANAAIEIVSKDEGDESLMVKQEALDIS
jgi:hypothetical protein